MSLRWKLYLVLAVASGLLFAVCVGTLAALGEGSGA